MLGVLVEYALRTVVVMDKSSLQTTTPSRINYCRLTQLQVSPMQALNVDALFVRIEHSGLLFSATSYCKSTACTQCIPSNSMVVVDEDASTRASMGSDGRRCLQRRECHTRIVSTSASTLAVRPEASARATAA
jgi:hypothetical protein